ncbi:shootin-1-like isoform 2-T2 [Discoglossus pictus]
MLCGEDDSFHLPAIQESSDDESSESETECEKEREEVKKKLQDFEEVSHKLLAEISMLEAEYEIEKTCREQAEVFATQISKENKKLKRISMQMMPMLYDLPEEIQKLVTEDQEIPDIDTDLVYQQQIKDLQETINTLLEERKVSSVEVEELKNQIKQLNEQIEEERLEKKCVFASLVKNQRTLKKLKSVSLMVTQHFNVMMDDLEKEQELRQHAELFAHKMLSDQQVAKRQSTILMQNVEPSVLLVKALEEVSVLTASLEETREKFERKIMKLQTELAEKPSEEEFDQIQKDLAVTKEQNIQLQGQLKEAEDKSKLLEEKVNELEEKLEEAKTFSSQMEDTPEAPASPPLPPPPPPAPPLPNLQSKIQEDPLALIRQRRGMKISETDQEKDCNDVKAEAVKEMMERIKNGIVLRPARKDKQSQAVTNYKRKSVINELQGLLKDSMNKPVWKKSYRRISRKINDNELDCVLLRRRKIVDISLKNDVAADKPKETPENDASKPPVAQSAKENHPVLVKLRQRTSELQQSRRMMPESSTMLWQ